MGHEWQKEKKTQDPWNIGRNYSRKKGGLSRKPSKWKKKRKKEDLEDLKIESKKKFVKRDYTQTEDAKSAKIAFNPNLHLLRKDEIVSGKTFPWEEISIESK